MRRVVAVSIVAGALGALVACGGSSARESGPSVVVAGQTQPSPSPSPSPSPEPTPTPQPSPTPTGINDNDRPVVRVGAGVFYVKCGDEILPGRGHEEAPVGCRVVLDATPKDEDNVPTNPRYPVEWHYSHPNLLHIGGTNPLGPIIEATAPHRQSIYVRVDGVNSNTFTINFR